MAVAQRAERVPSGPQERLKRQEVDREEDRADVFYSRPKMG